jgi:hypothetical protein
VSLSLEDEILLLRAQVDYLLERVAEAPDLAERPVNWAALTQIAAAEQWQRLIEWTGWLRDRYQLHATVPTCWYAHGAMLEELAALRSAWTAAFLDPQAAPGDAAAWHDLLDRTRYRLRAWDRNGCADGTHRPDHELPDDTDPVLRDRTIQADLDQRADEGDTR